MQDAEAQHLISFADAAIQVAQDMRRYHRKRTRASNAQRQTDIRHAQEQIAAAMRPIRSALGRAPYDPINPATQRRHAALKDASQRLQVERRKLWKLQNNPKRAVRLPKPPQQETAAA